MGKFDVLKQYKVQIGADTTEFLKELNKLESEANKKLKDLNLSEGLRNDVEKLVDEIGVMKTMLTSVSNDVKNNFSSISTSVDEFNKKMDTFQETMRLFTSNGSIEKATGNIGEAFKNLSDNITDAIGKFKDVYGVIDQIQQGKIDASVLSGLNKNSKKVVKDFKTDTKDLKKYVKELEDYIGLHKIDLLNIDSFENKSRQVIFKTKALFDSVEKEVKALGSSVDANNILANKLSFGTGNLKDVRENLLSKIDLLNEDLGEKMPKEIHSEIRFKIDLDKDVEGTATAESLERKVNAIVDAAQKKIKTVKIPIGYKVDDANITDPIEAESAEKLGEDKYIFRNINLKVKANTGNLISQIKSSIKQVNEKLKGSDHKIEVEVVGKVNPETIESSKHTIAEEVEDAQLNLKNNYTLQGGKISLDSASGIASESTLSDIRAILSQWNTTGIPGTQSKEFKEQLKDKANIEATSSDFDRYFRKFFAKPTKDVVDKENTTDYLTKMISMRFEKKAAAKALRRNRTVKKGGEEGLKALRESDLYTQKVTIDGVDYSKFEIKMPLDKWQAKLEEEFKRSFDQAGNIIGGLWDIEKKELDGKKKKIKGFLSTTIDHIDKQQKATRETLSLLNVNYKQDEHGNYTDEILYENDTILSTEDAFAKTKNVVDRIKADASVEYKIQEAKTKELETQKALMQQIYDLMQKQKDSPLSAEENDLLISLQNELRSRTKVIAGNTEEEKAANRKKVQGLENERKSLELKHIKEGLSDKEFKRFNEIDGEIEGLYQEVQDLSKYVIDHMKIDIDTGFSYIDQRIKESKQAAQNIISTAQEQISRIFSPTDEEVRKIGVGKGSYNAEIIENNYKKKRGNYTTVRVKNQAQYDYNEEKIKKAKERNAYLSRLVSFDYKTKKFDYSAMTEAEKVEYINNQKLIKTLQAMNLVYRESIGLQEELTEGKRKHAKVEKEVIADLHVKASDKEGYESIISEMGAAGLSTDPKKFLSGLSDAEFDQAIAAVIKVNDAIDKRSTLSEADLEGLIKSRIEKDIESLKKKLKQEEADLAKMEKDPEKYSKKAIKTKQNSINRLTKSIAELEDPNSTRSSAKILAEQRGELSKVQKQRENIISQIKEELGLTDEQIKLVKELFAVQKNISDVKNEIKDKDKKLNTSVISQNPTDGQITPAQAEDLKLSRGLLYDDLGAFELREKELVAELSSSTNVDALKQLGILNLSYEERNALEKKEGKYALDTVKNLAKKLGLNEENIQDLEKILVLEEKIAAEQKVNDNFQKTINSSVYDEAKQSKKSSKKNKSVVQQALAKEGTILQTSMAASENELENALVRKEKSDDRLKELQDQKQEAVNSLIPIITNQVKFEIQETINGLQTLINNGDASAATKLKKEEWEEILNSPIHIQDIVQKRIDDLFTGIDGIYQFASERVPKDGSKVGTQMSFTDGISQLFLLLEDNLNQEEAISDFIFQFLARINKSGAFSGKHFRANSGMADAAFDPFDTTYDPVSMHEARSELYRQQLKDTGSSSIGTARKMLEIAKEVAAERAKEKQHLADIHKKEQDIIKEEQKRIDLSEKKQKAEIDAKFGSADDDNYTDGIIGEARVKKHEASKLVTNVEQKVKDSAEAIKEIESKSENKIVDILNKEKEIVDKQKRRASEIEQLQKYISSRKEGYDIPQNKDESDEAYQKRKAATEQKEQEKLINAEKKLEELIKANKTALKEEEKQLKDIAKQRKEFIKQHGYSTELSQDDLRSNANASYEEFKKVQNKYHSAKSRNDVSEEEMQTLEKQFEEIRNQFISDTAKYFANNTADNIDKSLAAMIAKLEAEEKKKSNPSDIYLASEKAINDAQKKRIDSIETIKKSLKEASEFSVDQLNQKDGESSEDFEIRKQNVIKLNQEKIIKLQEQLNQKQNEHSSLLELEERQLLRLRFEQQSRLKLEEQTADLKKDKTNHEQELTSAKHAQEIADSQYEMQLQARKEAEKELSLRKEIKTFQNGMNAKQKRASLGVDLELMKIQDLQEELGKTSPGTDQYKALERQIIEAKRELELFRKEAEELGLTLSKTTGRMFLKHDTKLTGLSYNGFFKERDISKAPDSYVPTDKDIARQKEFEREQVKSYARHSDIVEAVRAERNERQKLWKAHYIAGMTNEQAEITLDIKKTVASVKDWNKATDTQKKKLQELHEKAKALDLEIGDNNYVNALVQFKDFKLDPEKYTTNDYIKQILASPTGSYSKFDATQITNVRLATESTLQNIQKILMTGIKVKIMGDNKWPNYKGKLNPLPDINAENDPYGYIVKKREEQEKKRASWVYKPYDEKIVFNYDKMLPEQKEFMKKFAETRNRLWKDGVKNESVQKELDALFAEAKNYNLTIKKSKPKGKNKTSYNSGLYLKTEDIGKPIGSNKQEEVKNTSDVKETKKKGSKKKQDSTKKVESIEKTFGEGVSEINSAIKQAKAQLNKTNSSEETKAKWKKIYQDAIAEGEKRKYAKNEHGYFVDETKEGNTPTITPTSSPEETKQIKAEAEAKQELASANKDLKKSEQASVSEKNVKNNSIGIVEENVNNLREIANIANEAWDSLNKGVIPDQASIEALGKFQTICTDLQGIDNDLAKSIDETLSPKENLKNIEGILNKLKEIDKQADTLADKDISKDDSVNDTKKSKKPLNKAYDFDVTDLDEKQLKQKLSAADTAIAKGYSTAAEWEKKRPEIIARLEEIQNEARKTTDLVENESIKQEIVVEQGKSGHSVLQVSGHSVLQVSDQEEEEVKFDAQEILENVKKAVEQRQALNESVLQEIDQTNDKLMESVSIAKNIANNESEVKSDSKESLKQKILNKVRSLIPKKDNVPVEDVISSNIDQQIIDPITTIPSEVQDLIHKYQLLLELNNRIYSEGGKAFAKYGSSVVMALNQVEDKLTYTHGIMLCNLDTGNESISGVSDVDDYINDNVNKFIPMEQFKQGMLENRPALEKAVAELASIPEEVVREILDINSPSEVMKKLGLWTGQGFAEGVMESSASVKEAIQTMLASGKVTEEEVKKLIDWDGYDKGKSMFKRNTKVGQEAWESFKGALNDKDLFNYQKQETKYLSLNKARELVSKAGLKGVDDNNLKALGEKVGNKWKIAEDAVQNYIKSVKEAIKVQEELNHETQEFQTIQEALNYDTEEYKTIQDIASKNGLFGALDITRTKSMRKKKNGAAYQKVLYNVSDAYGNTAVIDDYGEIKKINKVKEVISREAQEVKQLMAQISSTLNNSAVQEIGSYMTELLLEGEAEKVTQLRDLYMSLSNVLTSFENGVSNFTEEELEAIKVQLQQIDIIKKNFTGEAISLGIIDPANAKNLQTTLKNMATAFEGLNIENVKFNKNNREMTYQVIDRNKMLNTYRITVDKTGEAVRELVQSEKHLNTFERLFSSVGKKFGEIFNYFVASTSIHEVINFFRQGVTVVQEFDTALTEMRKVSDETVESLKEFQKTSFNIANEIGSTAKQIQDSAANFMRLGYSLEEAASLAKDANIYANVGDMEITEATEHMVSSIKAWSSEFANDTEASMAIIDRYNEIGNNFAITSADIGSAMERSAAALKAGGNTLNEALGLITAGNLIQQDADTTANALKVMSLRIRGSKTELEDMGEETDGLASSSSKLREEIMALSGVDIMKDANTYKSTAEIIKEIGKVYESMSDVSQASLLEKLAGKTRASTVAGLLENYKVIDEVIQRAEQADGSAMKENLKYMDSIEGKMAQFTNEVQELWYSLLDSDVVKEAIDVGIDLVNIVDNIISGISDSQVADFIVGILSTSIDLVEKLTNGLGKLSTVIAGIGLVALKNKFSKDSSGGRVKYVYPHSKICHRIV